MPYGTYTSIPEEHSKRPSSKAAASEERERTLRYVEPLNDAKTTLADFFSILPNDPGQSYYSRRRKGEPVFR